MRLELSRRAQADLDEIRDHSVGQFGVDQTIAYLDGIERAFRQLLAFPKMGSTHATLIPEIRSIGCQQHRIYYALDRDRIVVVRVLHKAMDVERWV